MLAAATLRHQRFIRNSDRSAPVGPDMTDIAAALSQGGIADITTTGRTSGEPRRIEIWFHHLDGDLYLTGRPGRPRDWMANLTADPRFTLHLKRGVTADLAATAERIDDPAARATILFRLLTESWDRDPDETRADLPRWVESAPLVRFTVDT